MLGKHSVIEPHPQFSPQENFLVEKYLTLGVGKQIVNTTCVVYLLPITVVKYLTLIT